jgi:hypothetical protein
MLCIQKRKPSPYMFFDLSPKSEFSFPFPASPRGEEGSRGGRYQMPSLDLGCRVDEIDRLTEARKENVLIFCEGSRITGTWE